MTDSWVLVLSLGTLRVGIALALQTRKSGCSVVALTELPGHAGLPFVHHLEHFSGQVVVVYLGIS